MRIAVVVITTVLLAQPASAQQVLPSEPPPGSLGPGQVVYVSCGAGKARKITGGSNMQNGQVGQGAARKYGPCVAMKNQ